MKRLNDYAQLIKSLCIKGGKTNNKAFWENLYSSRNAKFIVQPNTAYNSTNNAMLRLLMPVKGQQLFEVIYLPLPYDIKSNTDNSIKNNAPTVLYQNYPNPATNTTTIKYYTANAVPISLKIYDMYGHVINDLSRNLSYTTNSVSSVSYDASSYMSGIYIIRLITANGSVYQKQMIVNK